MERAARAIQQWHHENGKLRPSLQEAEGQARAVLQAIREPSEEMNTAGMEVTGDKLGDHVQSTWQAMIDAALAERSQ